jgi:hypothetical protein
MEKIQGWKMMGRLWEVLRLEKQERKVRMISSLLLSLI